MQNTWQPIRIVIGAGESESKENLFKPAAI